MTKEVREQFARIVDIDLDHLKLLDEKWDERRNSKFFEMLDTLRELIDNLYEGKRNPMLYVEATYCFDGDAEWCTEKVRRMLEETFGEGIPDNIVEAFVELEVESELY